MILAKEYPLKNYDELGRLIYVDWNGSERVINIYWDKTKNIKIKYRFFGNDLEVKAYNKEGEEIIEYTPGTFKVNLPQLKINNDVVQYNVDKKKLKEWLKILKNNQKK